MKFAILARRSLAKEDFENQTLLSEKWISDNKHEHYCTYQEDEHGNTANADREVLQGIFVDASNREFDVLMVWRSDRLTRDGIEALLQILRRFSEMGIKVYSYTEGWLDNSTPINRFILAGRATMGEEERELIALRSKNKHATIRLEIEQKGYHISKKGRRITQAGRPIHRIGKKGEGRLLSIQEIEDIKTAHFNGTSLRQLARDFGCSTTAITTILTSC